MLQFILCVHFHAWFKKIIIKSEFATQSLFKTFCCEKMLSGSLYGNICQLIAHNLSILYCNRNQNYSSSSITSYFCDDHLKNQQIDYLSNILLKKRLFFVTNRNDSLWTQNPVTGSEDIPERKAVYCSLYKNKKSFSTHYGPVYQLSY